MDYNEDQNSRRSRVEDMTDQGKAYEEALVLRCAICLTARGEDDDEFCLQDCRAAWWQEYKRSDVQAVA